MTLKSNLTAPRALVVEDYCDTSEALVQMLRHRGLVCESAGDIREAVEKFNSACDAGRPCYDVMILDVDLPSASGLQLLKAVRAIHKTLPVFILTAYRSAVVDQRAKEFNASVDDKPLNDPAEFISRVVDGAKAHNSRGGKNDHARLIVPELVEAMIAHAATASRAERD